MRIFAHLENCTERNTREKLIEKGYANSLSTRANCYIALERGKITDQANKSIGWMPWHQLPMKDAAICEKPRGAESTH